MELPDILEARSVAAWLSDALARLQRRGVSQRQFARDSGIKLGTLSHVLKGSRKLDPAHIPKVAVFLELDPYEAGVLESMVALERSDDNRARYNLSGRERMLRAHRLGAADSGFLERWSTAAIRELMRLEGWRPDPAWIAARLRPRVTEEEAREALALLGGLTRRHRRHRRDRLHGPAGPVWRLARLAHAGARRRPPGAGPPAGATLLPVLHRRRDAAGRPTPDRRHLPLHR